MANTRNEIEVITDENIYDNSNKEIDPSMVRAVIEALKDSYFNLLDDELSGYKYDATRILSDVISLPLFGSTGSFNVGTGSGSISGNTGIISSATYTTIASNNTEVTVNLSQDISDREIIPTLSTEDTDTDENNDVGFPVYRVVSGTQIVFGLREITSSSQNIKIKILAFKTE